jgi:1-deoxy-D-xylulose-5-phosphate synthase
MSSILDKINSPSDLKGLSCEELKQLANDIREELVKVISINGGHLASSLGTVELTIALHRIFNTPDDKIIWDVGHQSYAHKLLTGRRDRFSTIRQYGGLSGFPLRSESPHDAFGTGHAGTSISAALGIALARDLNKEHFNVVAVIGDGSLSAGMAFEAINHAGHLGTKLIIVLNDNGVSISPSVGALSKLLNKVRTDTKYEGAKRRAKKAIIHLPFGQKFWMLSKRMKSGMESVILPNAFWNQLGFTYLGPVDGHNIREMESSLIRARDMESGPTVIHVMTKKGKGNSDAEEDVVKYHGISPSNGEKSHAPSYSQVFGLTVSRLMKDNNRLVVISAAMLDGTGLAHVALKFPGRVFDVGICEQHAVTLAAGLATQGLIPIVAIYSTFLQRSYDQIIHDVCTQNLPVVFAIDRAGIVGEDGKTHHGPFDISYLRCIPDMIIASPANEDELQHLLFSATHYGQPVAIRYPRGSGEGIELSKEFKMISPGKAEIVRQGKDITILAIGTTVYRALEAAELLSKEGVDCTVVNSRFAKPLEKTLFAEDLAVQ